jgi:hypothetical protein
MSLEYGIFVITTKQKPSTIVSKNEQFLFVHINKNIARDVCQSFSYKVRQQQKMILSFVYLKHQY